MERMLLIDHDAYLTDLLGYMLKREGFDVVSTSTGREALAHMRTGKIDLVILDINLPDTDGLRLLAALRTCSQAPVIILTARSREEDVIAAFQGGADDYVVKPFSMRILVNRVKAVLRRTVVRRTEQARPGVGTYRVGTAVFDVATNDVVSPTMSISLTPTESRVLHLLFAHEGQAFSSERIMEHIWGYNSSRDVSVVKTHIRHIREKINSLPGSPQPIHTVPGRGYTARQIAEHDEIVVQASQEQREMSGVG